MKKPILNLKNSEVGNVEVDMNIFGLKIFPDIIHQYIRYQVTPLPSFLNREEIF